MVLNSSSSDPDFLEFLLGLHVPKTSLTFSNDPMASQSTFNLVVGTSVTFSLIACASVGLRLYARVRIIKLARHDDAVLILALVGPLHHCLVK